MQLLKIISLLLFTVSCKAIPHWKGQKLNGSPHFIPSPCFIPSPQSVFYTDGLNIRPRGDGQVSNFTMLISCDLICII